MADAGPRALDCCRRNATYKRTEHRRDTASKNTKPTLKKSEILKGPHTIPHVMPFHLGLSETSPYCQIKPMAVTLISRLAIPTAPHNGRDAPLQDTRDVDDPGR